MATDSFATLLMAIMTRKCNPLCAVWLVLILSVGFADGLVHGQLQADSVLAEQAAAKTVDWDTEVLNARVTKALEQVFHLPLDSGEPHLDALSRISVDRVQSTALRPQPLVVIYRDEALAIYEPPLPHDPALVAGLEHLREAVRSLAQPFDGGRDLRVKFKVIRVIKRPQTATTYVLYQANGQTDDGFIQQDATWHCDWVANTSGEPLLASVSVVDYRETRMVGAGGRLFADCTEAVLGRNRCFEQDLAFSTPYWRRRLASVFNTTRSYYHGLAIGDVNGDGLDDVYVCAMAGLPNRMFVQQPDGTAIDTAGEAGVDWLDGSRGALLIDLDNDGDQDLALVTKSNTLFMANDGTGHFTLRTSMDSPRMRTALSALDYDNDGDLDIFICRYGLTELADVDPAEFTDVQLVLGIPNPSHDANNGAPNSMLRNDGGFQFTDVTAECGLDESNNRFGFASACEDYDNDGDQDIYVANDAGRNNLYRNDGGVFTDVAAEAGVEALGAGMGCTWGDYNNDGFMDLYVSNMFSAAGNRITLQPEWQAYLFDSRGAERGALDVNAVKSGIKGNTLFANLGNGTFQDVTKQAGVGMALWSWGGLFVDINNDGRSDLVVPTGYITNESTHDL